MLELLGIASIVVSLFFLIVSSVHDYRTREVPNYVWLAYGPIGVLLSVTRYLLVNDTQFLVTWLVSFGITTVLSFLIFYFGFFGGADAKALICVALAMPSYPFDAPLITGISLPFFSLSVFSNSVLTSSLLVLGIATYNLLTTIRNPSQTFKDLETEPLWKKIIAFVTAVKVDVQKIREGSHYMQLEDFTKDENGKIKRHLKISARLEDDEETENKIEQIPEEIIGKIWATPGLPFLIFITLGFILALLVGDIITSLAFRSLIR